VEVNEAAPVGGVGVVVLLVCGLTSRIEAHVWDALVATTFLVWAHLAWNDDGVVVLEEFGVVLVAGLAAVACDFLDADLLAVRWCFG
jgi:hypothetical protein